MRRTRRAAATVVALLAGCALLLGASASSSNAASVPVVRPGQHVVLHAAGFRPRAAVVVAIKNLHGRLHLHADAHGELSVRVHAPSRPGRYYYLFVGDPASSGRPGAPPTRGRGDHQVVELAVPRLVTDPVIVRTPPRGGGHGTGGQGTGTGHHPGTGGHGTGGQGAHSGSAGTGSGTTGSGTANTGFDILAGVTAGVLALVAGAAFVLLGRRRRRSAA